MEIDMGIVKRPTTKKAKAEDISVADAEAEVKVEAEVVEEVKVEAEVVEEVKVESEVGEEPKVGEPKVGEPTTEVAVHSSTEVATAAAGFEAEAAEEGMDGLEIGYGSFPTVKLDSGVFVDGDGIEYGEKFEFTPMASRAVHAYAQKNEEDGDVFFSYDGKVTTKGEKVSDLLAEWVADGFEAKEDTRLEVTVQLEESGDIVMLSLPPTARKKFSGQMAVLRARGVSYQEAVIVAEVGKPVKVGSRTFRPWVFKIRK